MRIHPVVNVDKVKPFIEPLVPHQEPGPETGKLLVIFWVYVIIYSGGFFLL